jgi:hypothetical protein
MGIKLFKVNTDGSIDCNKKVENHTLKDLKQKLINDMYELGTYGKEDIEILKLLFETKKD